MREWKRDNSCQMRQGVMRSFFFFTLIFFFSLLAFADTPNTEASSTNATRYSMNEAYQAFRALQPYLSNYDKFEDPANEKEISKQIKKLLMKFHQVSVINKGKDKAPGFTANLNVLNDMLSDLDSGFRKGNKRWAYSRLKTVSNHCITCHTSYKVGVKFYDKTDKIDKLDPYSRGEFYLASRQFNKAKDEYFKAALNPGNPPTALQALRKWLIIYTRVSHTPDPAIKKLQEVLKSSVLLPYEVRIVEEWIRSLHKWKEGGIDPEDSWKGVKNLLKYALQGEDPLLGRVDDVDALRATALLHKTLEDPNLSSEKRGEALYLLGLSYSRLPLFFINELPELYLEQCIYEHPNTPSAQQAFFLYKDIVTTGYTGTHEPELPPEVSLKFLELYNLAFGISAVDGRV